LVWGVIEKKNLPSYAEALLTYIRHYSFLIIIFFVCSELDVKERKKNKKKVTEKRKQKKARER
jgi:hypothetical protein